MLNIYNKLLKIADICMYTEIIMVWKKFKVKCNEHYLLKKKTQSSSCVAYSTK